MVDFMMFLEVAKGGDFVWNWGMDLKLERIGSETCVFFLLPKATCIENIDIGGPAMIRASAKNNAAVSGS